VTLDTKRFTPFLSEVFIAMQELPLKDQIITCIPIEISLKCFVSSACARIAFVTVLALQQGEIGWNPIFLP
jgi:hypothetical protein